MKIKVYLSGPVTGRDEHTTKVLFDIAEKAIRNMNLEPVNPLKLGCKGGVENWHDDMKTCIRALLDCHMIVMLHGWEESDGATMEHEIAKKLNINQLKIQL